MKDKFGIIFLFSLIKLLNIGYSSRSFSNTPITQSVSIFGNEVSSAVRKLFANKMNKTIHNETLNISKNCRDLLYSAYVDGPHSDFFYLKLFKDSSKNKNDVGSFNNCMNTNYLQVRDSSQLIKQLAYLIISIELRNHRKENLTNTSFEANWYIIGTCIVAGCSETDYSNLIFGLNSEFNNFLLVDNSTSISVYKMEDHVASQFKPIYLLFLLPVMIIFIQILFVLCPYIPMFIFKCCFRRKSKRKVANNNISHSAERVDAISQAHKTSDMGASELWSSEKSSVSKKELFQFKSSFNLTENGEELFNLKPIAVSSLNNESGMTYIKGISGISMFFLVFGLLFFNLYNSPVKIYGETSFIKLNKSFFFGIIFYGLRYSPRILFSCSGFCLVFKFLCYLDDRLETEIERKMSIEAKQKNEKQAKNSTNNAKDDESDSSDGIENSSITIVKDPMDIPVGALWRFIYFQFHKYFLFILVLCFFKFSLFYIIMLIKEVGPMWVCFKINISTASFSTLLDLLGHIFLFFGFGLFEEVEDCLLNIFWMVGNEMTFFILTSVLIFICYKHKIKFDKIIILMILILIIGRFMVVCFIPGMHSTLYYYFYDYGKYFISPVYNYPYYLIGVLFGMMNYIVQKGITYSEAFKQEKPLLILSVAVVNLLKRISNKCLYVLTILGGLVYILFTIVQPLFLACYPKRDKHLRYYFKSTLMNMLYLIDIEFIVCITHFIAFAFYLKGENLVNQFLTSHFWLVFNRLYFSIILLINPVMLYMFYQSETRLKIELGSILFYSIIAGIFLLFIACFHYIFFELPLKRIIKLFANRESSLKEKRSSHEDASHTKEFVSNTTK